MDRHNLDNLDCHSVKVWHRLFGKFKLCMIPYRKSKLISRRSRIDLES